MKIFHTTDLHFNKQWFEWIATQQDNFDIFCISGDFLEGSKDETLKEQIVWLTSWIKLFEKPLFTCSGNHDIEELEYENWLSEIDTTNYYSDNTVKSINDIKFGCYPYIGGEGYYDFDECDVFITHIPPTKTQTAIYKTEKSDWGDRELYFALENEVIKPKLVLCGHMHKPTRTVYKMCDTTIYNPGVDKNNKIPNYHIIEV